MFPALANEFRELRKYLEKDGILGDLKNRGIRTVEIRLFFDMSDGYVLKIYNEETGELIITVEYSNFTGNVETREAK